MIELEFVELHQDLFLAGKNFSKKLDPKKMTGLKLHFHPSKEMLTIEWNGKVAFTHWINAAAMIPKNPEDIGVVLGTAPTPRVQNTFETHPQKLSISGTAQVSTPTSHVFNGKGSGQTGRATKDKAQS